MRMRMTRQRNGGGHRDGDDTDGCQPGEQQAAPRRLSRCRGYLGHTSSSLIAREEESDTALQGNHRAVSAPLDVETAQRRQLSRAIRQDCLRATGGCRSSPE
jgi:hypothetical protein